MCRDVFSRSTKNGSENLGQLGRCVNRHRNREKAMGGRGQREEKGVFFSPTNALKVESISEVSVFVLVQIRSHHHHG